MNISITPELEAFIDTQVKSGMYASSSEVVRAALRKMLREEQSFEEWKADARQKIDAGWESLQAGRAVSGEQVFRELNEKFAKLSVKS